MYSGHGLSLFAVCLPKCSLQGHGEISLLYGIPQIGSNRLTNWTESYIESLSFGETQ